ncbi:MAG: polymerase sigma factor RpoE [Myxococcales bacterium]|nr:polymerase sigma factor RpoE [Myxococcales bacterium]
MMLSRRPQVPVQRDARLTFDELYDAHAEFLWRNARRLGVADDAVDDVLQQVFLVVHRRLPEVSIAGSEKAWLFGVLLRVIKDHRRQLRRKSPHTFFSSTNPDTLADDRARQPDESFARSEATILLQRLLDALSEDKRQVFILSQLEELTAPEISEATSTNLSTVYSRLRAARQEFEAAAAQLYQREGRKP